MIGLVVGTQGSGPITGSYVQTKEPVLNNTFSPSIDYSPNSLPGIDGNRRVKYTPDVAKSSLLPPLTDLYNTPLNSPSQVSVYQQQVEIDAKQRKKWLTVAVAGVAVAFIIFLFFMHRSSANTKK